MRIDIVWGDWAIVFGLLGNDRLEHDLKCEWETKIEYQLNGTPWYLVSIFIPDPVEFLDAINKAAEELDEEDRKAVDRVSGKVEGKLEDERTQPNLKAIRCPKCGRPNPMLEDDKLVCWLCGWRWKR